MIKLDKLTFQVEGKVLLSAISTQFSSGKIHTLLGPNGAGKSTLLSCLTKDLTSYQGQIIFENRDLTQWNYADLAGQRGVLAQQHQVSFAFTVAQIIALGLQAAGHQADEPKIQAIANTFDLEALLSRSYLTLSGGEQQRTQLARVFAQLGHEDLSEKWLFLDEWTQSLDLKHIQRIGHLIQDLVKKGLSVVMVLHDLNLAWSLSDECYLMKAGQLVFSGPPDSVLTAEHIREVFDVAVTIQTGATESESFSKSRWIQV